MLKRDASIDKSIRFIKWNFDDAVLRGDIVFELMFYGEGHEAAYWLSPIPALNLATLKANIIGLNGFSAADGQKSNRLRITYTKPLYGQNTPNTPTHISAKRILMPLTIFHRLTWPINSAQPCIMYMAELENKVVTTGYFWAN